jgi:hypothetical protein
MGKISNYLPWSHSTLSTIDALFHHGTYFVAQGILKLVCDGFTHTLYKISHILLLMVVSLH